MLLRPHTFNFNILLKLATPTAAHVHCVLVVREFHVCTIPMQCIALFCPLLTRAPEV